jgi:predicted ATPase/class 3 adenylate cyclase
MRDPALPTGTVTFLFTDLEVSTRLWEQEPDAMREALARHDEILRAAVASNGGHVVKGRGDGVHAAFATADDAVRAAVGSQVALGAELWPVSEPLRVRIGLHTGVAELRDGDYFGSPVNRAARLMDVAHGGQIVCSQATADLAREGLAADVVLVDLGEHRLRDLSRAERVFQVNAADLAANFAPLRSLESSRGNLPLATSSFIGREVEVHRVTEALGHAKVVTLSGVGGVGKTRLALQVAAELAPRFRDGTWLCELAAVRDPAKVVDAVASAFRVTARPGMSLDGSLVAFLRDQQVLIVLDNCEHVLRPVAALVTAIEAACSDVRVLATSREGLNIHGEQILVVPSLGVPDDGVSVEALVACEAVRLFVDRARGVKADFALDAANADGVANVCRRLDGVPLAIELAAVRVSAMNPAELADRLDRRFRLLTGGARVAIERHQTLRATIDWSFDLLSAAEQRLLVRLSVFSGGCTLAAVEAVCVGAPVEVDDVFELVARLVAHHLVVADDTGPETRYRLLETIRQYGEERLAEHGETDALRARHCDHYTELAGLVQAHLWGSGQVEWGTRLAREHDNLFAAMAFALDTEDLDRAMALLCQLPVLLFGGAQIDDLVAFDPAPILALPGAADHPAFPVALVAAGWEAFRRDEGPVALALCDDAAPRFDVGVYPFFVYSLLGLRAMVAVYALWPDASEQLLDVARRARTDDLPGLAAIFLGGAAILEGWDDVNAATSHGTEALTLARESGMPTAICTSLLGLASALAADDPDHARVLLDEALQLAAGLGYESPFELRNAVLVAARLGVWPRVLLTASRLLHHQRRSGGLDIGYLSFVRSLAARGLAADQPESAAVLDGAATALLGRLSVSLVAPTEAGPSAQVNGALMFAAGVAWGTSQLLTAVLGDERLAELREQGAAMDDDHVIAFALAAIDRALADPAVLEA